MKKQIITSLFVAFLVFQIANISSASSIGGEFNNPVIHPIMNETDATAFLPAVMKTQPKLAPINLVAPSDGATLDTLIPTLVFETDEIPADTAGCLTFGTEPDPEGCWSSFGLYSDMYRERVLWFNLQPSTTYYWRVGAAYNYNYDNIEWSEQRTFTTGPAGGVIVSAPVHVSPADGSVVSSDSLTLDWEAVDGAVEYYVRVHDKDKDRRYGVSGILPPQTYLGPDSLAWIFDFAEGLNFEWQVKARNDYAWGPESEYWDFTLNNSNSAVDPLSGGEQIFESELMPGAKDLSSPTINRSLRDPIISRDIGD